MIQLLKKSTSVFASFVHDYEYRGADTSKIIEMTDCSYDKLFLCTSTILSEGFEFARAKFHEQIPLNFDHYMNIMIQQLCYRKKIGTVVRSAVCTVKRYGFSFLFLRSFFGILAQGTRKLMIPLFQHHEDN